MLNEHELFYYGIIYSDIYINRTPTELVDSLVLTYENPSIESDYYNKFWKRRQAEKNDETVYKIVKEVSQTLQYKSDLSVLAPKPDPQYVNDTLKHLLEIEYGPEEDLTVSSALKEMNLLKRYGMHQSAYNLANQYSAYSIPSLNVDSLAKTLTISDESKQGWFEYYNK